MLLVLKLLVAPGLVTAVTLAVRRWGSGVGGWLSGMPVVAMITAFTHAQRGSPATVAFVGGFVRAIIGFGLFCFALALTVDRLGLAAGLAFALAAQVAVSGLTLRASRAA